MGWRVTRHACERWLQRIEDVGDTWTARNHILRAVHRSIIIPNRLASEIWVPKFQEGLTSKHRRHGFRYRFTSKAVLITGGNRILTVIDVSHDVLATILVWQMTGWWVPGPKGSVVA